MWTYLLNNPLLVSVIAFSSVLLGGFVWSRVENHFLEKKINVQKEVIQHQELMIAALKEDVKNAKLKQKHHEVAKSLGDDALRERMQHEGYYRA